MILKLKRTLTDLIYYFDKNIYDFPILFFSVFRTLVLKDFGIKYLLPLLQNISISGVRLRRVDLHYIEASPGISIEAVDRLCPFLEQLTICDSLITWTYDQYDSTVQGGRRVSMTPWYCERHRNKACSMEDHFINLKSCKLYRVDYKHSEDWEIFFRFGRNLKSLHLESSRHMTDTTFNFLLSDQGLSNLEVMLNNKIRSFCIYMIKNIIDPSTN